MKHPPKGKRQIPEEVWRQLEELGVCEHPDHGFLKVETTVDPVSRTVKVSMIPVAIEFQFEVNAHTDCRKKYK